MFGNKKQSSFKKEASTAMLENVPLSPIKRSPKKLGKAALPTVDLDEFKAQVSSAPPISDEDSSERSLGSRRRRGGDHSERGDQLPDVEEIKAATPISSSAFLGDSTKYKVILISALLITMAGIFIAIGVVIGRDTAPSANTSRAYSTPTRHSDGKTHPKTFEDVVNLIIKSSWSDETAVKTEGTPQHNAAQWIAVDPQPFPSYANGKEAYKAEYESFKQRYALAVFYYAMSGNEWRKDINWLSVDPVCQWNDLFESKTSNLKIQVGVLCGDYPDTVKGIFLPAMELKGDLPEEIGLLDQIEALDLYNNVISGNLPSKMKNLKQLESLVMSNNHISGSLPDWLAEMPQLRTVNLALNNLEGEIPSNLALNQALTELKLDRNMLSGTLDPLKGMESLKALTLGDNKFTGGLTDDLLLSWSGLEELDLSDNLLEGKLPDQLLVMDGLSVVDLHGNSFDGEIPNQVLSNPSLKFLALNENKLTGPIDERITRQTSLEHLDLSKNLFTGDFPVTIGQLVNLKYLFIAFNKQLNPGPIPSEIGQLKNLIDLSLQASNRNGRIPYELEHCHDLVLLDLNDNDLEEYIPEELGALLNLKFFLVKDNQLSGDIPASFAFMSSLDTILLDGNSITGGVEHVCDPKLPALTVLIADCEIGQCTCCTKCCFDGDETCNGMVWFSDLDPLNNYHYERQSYKFYDEDIAYPIRDNGNFGMPVSTIHDDDEDEVYSTLGEHDFDNSPGTASPPHSGGEHFDPNDEYLSDLMHEHDYERWPGTGSPP